MYMYIYIYIYIYHIPAQSKPRITGSTARAYLAVELEHGGSYSYSYPTLPYHTLPRVYLAVELEQGGWAFFQEEVSAECADIQKPFRMPASGQGFRLGV